MTGSLIPDEGNPPDAPVPAIGVYAITLTGITKTITHMGVYSNSDEAIQHALDHVATTMPNMHLQVIKEKGHWDIHILYIPHIKAVLMFNTLLDQEPEQLIAAVQEVKELGIVNKMPEAAEAPLELAPTLVPPTKEEIERAEKNKLLASLISLGDMTLLIENKDKLSKAEYAYVYDQIK